MSDLFRTIKACRKYLKGNIDKNETPNSQVSIVDRDLAEVKSKVDVHFEGKPPSFVGKAAFAITT